MAKYHFSSKQFNEIKTLLKRRLYETRDEQKKTRARIRKLGFNISDYFNGFSDQDFQELLNLGIIVLVDSPAILEKEPLKFKLDETTAKERHSEKDSLPPIVDMETEILVLGTMPGENSLTNQQYYNNPNNQFWKIIFSIFNNGLSIDNYDKKIELLKKHKIGLWDVLKTCEREGSSDAKIKNIVLNNFEDFFNKYSKIKIVIFNGKDSYSYFKQFITKNFDKTFFQLNSTSSLNSHSTINQKTEEWERHLKKEIT